jgi:hypothetical protein
MQENMATACVKDGEHHKHGLVGFVVRFIHYTQKRDMKFSNVLTKNSLSEHL